MQTWNNRDLLPRLMLAAGCCLCLWGCATTTVDLLRDPDPAVRRKTLFGLSREAVGEFEVREQLMASLEDRDPDVRRTAARQIVALGLTAEVPEALKARYFLAAGDQEGLKGACSASSAETLIRVAEDASAPEEERTMARTALGTYRCAGLEQAVCARWCKDLTSNDSLKRAKAGERIFALGVADGLSPATRARAAAAAGRWDEVAAQCGALPAELLLQALRSQPAGSPQEQPLRAALSRLTCPEAVRFLQDAFAAGLASPDRGVRERTAAEVAALGFEASLGEEGKKYLAAVRGDFTALVGPGRCRQQDVDFVAACAMAAGTPPGERGAAALALAGSQCAPAMTALLRVLDMWPDSEPFPPGLAAAVAATDPALAALLAGDRKPAEVRAAVRNLLLARKEVESQRAEVLRALGAATPEAALIPRLLRLSVALARVGQNAEALASLGLADALCAYWGRRYLDMSLEAITGAMEGGDFNVYALEAATRTAREYQSKAREYLGMAFRDTLDRLWLRRIHGAVALSIVELALEESGADEKERSAERFQQALSKRLDAVADPEFVGEVAAAIGRWLIRGPVEEAVKWRAAADLGYVDAPASVELALSAVGKEFTPRIYEGLAVLSLFDKTRLLAALGDGTADQRFAAAFALGQGGKDAAVEKAVAARLQVETDSRVLLALRYAATVQGDTAAFEQLVATLRGGTGDTTLAALQVLQWLPAEWNRRIPPDAVEPFLSGPTDDHVGFALAILADTREKPGASVRSHAVELLDSSDSTVREQAARVLVLDCEAARRAVFDAAGSVTKDFEGFAEFIRECGVPSGKEEAFVRIVSGMESRLDSTIASLRSGWGSELEAEEQLTAASQGVLALAGVPGSASVDFLVRTLSSDFLDRSAAMALILMGVANKDAVLGALRGKSSSLATGVRAVLGDSDALDALARDTPSDSDLWYYVLAAKVTGDARMVEVLVGEFKRSDDVGTLATLAETLLDLLVAGRELP